MEEKQEEKYFIRIANNDLDGKRAIGHTLTSIKGVGFSFSNAICNAAGIDKTKKSGILTDDEVKKIEQVLNDPLKYGMPAWLFNRRKDPEDNTDKHLVTATLTFIRDNDIKSMKKMKSYRGIRHSFGLPVRGQKTRSNFRKNKGKVTGVKKVKTAPSAKGDKKNKD